MGIEDTMQANVFSGTYDGELSSADIYTELLKSSYANLSRQLYEEWKDWQDDIFSDDRWADDGGVNLGNVSRSSFHSGATLRIRL